MLPRIRPLDRSDHSAVIELSLRAWAPVFSSLEHVLHGSGVFQRLYPDWRVSQRDTVAAACTCDTVHMWIAEVDIPSVIAGFVAVVLDYDHSRGEIELLAVDPAYQRSGIGTALTRYARDRIREAGMSVAMVETGGDPGHAAARRTYQRAGFAPLPVVRYFAAL